MPIKARRRFKVTTRQPHEKEELIRALLAGLERLSARRAPKSNVSPACLSVTKIAYREDERTGDLSEVFEFQRVGSPFSHSSKRLRRIEVRRDEGHQVSALTGKLLKQGARLPEDAGEATALLRAAIASEPEHYELAPAHLGWREDRRAFMFRDKAMGEVEPGLHLVAPSWLHDLTRNQVKVSGRVKDWSREVAAPASGSSRLIMSICASFASVLFPFANLQPFGINIFGPSKVGKTTCLLSAGSVVGLGEVGDLLTWNITDAALQELLPAFNDCLIPVDELGMLKTDRGAYDRLKNFAYVLSSGAERKRHSSWRSEAGRWRGLLLSSSEHSIGDIAKREHFKRDLGEIIRFPDLPAVHGEARTIFDLERPTGSSEATLGSLQLACATHRGAAIRAFVKFLLARLEEVPITVSSATDRFVDEVTASGVDPALGHMARNFGLIYAGGVLAADAGMVPWKKRTIRKAVARCFDDAAALIHIREETPADIVRRIREKLSAAAIVDLDANPSPSLDELDKAHGCRQVKGGQTRLVLRTEWLQEILSKRARLIYFCRMLKRSGG